MAVKGQFETISGVQLSEAYANITSINALKIVNAESKYFFGMANINVFASPSAYSEGKRPVESFNFEFTVDYSELIMDQIYTKLKEHPRFISFVDC